MFTLTACLLLTSCGSSTEQFKLNLWKEDHQALGQAVMAHFSSNGVYGVDTWINVTVHNGHTNYLADVRRIEGPPRFPENPYGGPNWQDYSKASFSVQRTAEGWKVWKQETEWELIRYEDVFPTNASTATNQPAPSAD